MKAWTSVLIFHIVWSYALVTEQARVDKARVLVHCMSGQNRYGIYLTLFRIIEGVQIAVDCIWRGNKNGIKRDG